MEKQEPKFKVGDKVKFTFFKREFEGTIKALSKWVNLKNRNEQCYDIAIDNCNIPITNPKTGEVRTITTSNLCRHIQESHITLLEEENA